MKERLREILDELEQFAIDADDIGWTPVQHKIEEALGPLESALRAIDQQDEFI